MHIDRTKHLVQYVLLPDHPVLIHETLAAKPFVTPRERDVRPEGELGEPLLELLNSGHEGVLTHALALTGLWSVRQVEGDVLRCAKDKNLGVELRAAAFLSLARMNSNKAMGILKESLTNP